MPGQTELRLGPVQSLQDAARALQDVQRWADSVSLLLRPVLGAAAPVTPQVLVLESDGMVHCWDLVAGSGTTVNYDSGTRTIEITSP